MSAGLRPVIRIRPIAWAQGGEDQRYFAEGLTEDIAVELARFRGLFDVARVESGPGPGRLEHGDFGLEGAVRRAGPRTRVTMRLIGDDEAELWSEHYDQVAGETLAAQEALARSIAATTVGRIMGLAVEQARAKEPEHMLPFEALALGIDLLGRYAAEANFNARLLFGRVLVHDPTSARASAGLASTLIYEWIIRPDPALLERAYDQARTALALDGADAWCHMIVGRVHLMARRFELAEHFYARAAALNPCDTDILASYGLALAYLGRPDEGIGLILRARAMNRYVPAWHDENLGFAHFVARRYPEAIAAFDRMDDAPSWVFLARSAAQYHAGDRPAARAAVTQALILDPTERVSVYAATEPFLRQEDMDHLLAGLRGAGLPD